MTEDTANPAVPGPFRIDVVGDMTIEWDVPVPTSDGVVLRADVFRPSAPGPHPVILGCGPYGKGRPFQQVMPPAWQKMVTDYPDILEGSSGAYHTYEVVDPEKWVPDGYACVRIDVRGTGRSPGYLDPFTERETLDLYESIEWAAEQPWSDGRIGLSGISYLAINQWQVAALQPPHLAAICVWEGAGDTYRDAFYHGGILSTFVDRWYGLVPQYGMGESAGRNPHTGQPVCGDETFTEEELRSRRADFGQLAREHPLLDAYHRAHVHPDWSRIRVPVLSAGNWGGMGLHLRGNTLGFEQAASGQKWLTMHEDTHFSLFYAQYGLDLQKRFFGHFLKDEDTGWDKQPRVELRTRHADGRIGLRSAEQWPLPETEWTRWYLDAADASMGPTPAPSGARADYPGGDGRLSFRHLCTSRTEIAGPLAAKLFIDSSTADADLFLVLRAFAPDGTEVVFQGTNDPVVPVAQGWLRASHRALDAERSRPFLPVHPHDRTQPLTPGQVYELDVEILPTSLVLPAGYTLALDVQGHDYIHPGSGSGSSAAPGSFPHNDPGSRPADVFGGTVTLHTGGAHGSYLLLPVVSPT
jgi:predicted acyl esterase